MDFNYSELVAGLHTAYKSGKTRSLEWRKGQIQKIIDLLANHEDELLQALKDDLRKPKLEAMLLEINYSRNEAIYMYNNLANWMKPEKVARGLADKMNDCHIRTDPYGVALIIGAWNYPVQLMMCPLLGAIAAGNCALLKPSEIAVATGALLEKLLPKYLDNECFKVVHGGISETTALLKERYDVIFYTGNFNVGKVILRAAAEHITPVILEMGGKSPCYVDKNCDLSVVCKRILWGKCTNSGQTCLAPDYIMCHPDIQDSLVDHLKKTLYAFYGDDPQKTADYARIISSRHFERIKALLDGQNVAVGGDYDKEDLYIAPTVLTNVKATDPIMTEEIFGPILPILTVQSTSEAIDVINNHERALALYIFSNDKKVIDRIIDETSSGGVCVNDVIVHAGPATLPFGGIGHSGMGSYHGKFSYDAFTHKRGCLKKNLAMENINSIRCPPFDEKKLGWITWLLRKKQNSSGILSFLPFVVMGTIMAIVVKVLLAWRS